MYVDSMGKSQGKPNKFEADCQLFFPALIASKPVFGGYIV